MSGLLSLKKDMFLQMDIQRKNSASLFKCVDVIMFENSHNYRSTRYVLEQDGSRYLLDVQKDSMQNIIMTWYHLIEEMRFDLNFLSLVGTSPLGYHNPLMPNIDYILYEKLENVNEETEMLKFMVTEEEVPENPQEYGYYQDGNGHWYFMTERAKGSLLKFDNDYKLSWEYKQEKEERLLIELEAYTHMQDYIQQQPIIFIYEGEKIHRRDIKIMHEAGALEIA